MSLANQQHTFVANLDSELVAASHCLQLGVSQAKTPALPERLIEWHGLSFRVPSDWELVRHGSSPAVGSLGFVDRRRERMTLAWAKTESVPNLERLTQEIAREHAGSGCAAPLELGAWQALMFDTGAGPELRAVTYHAESSRLLELRISVLQGGVAEVETIARSFRVASPGELHRRWRAFGLDVRTPSDFALTGATVHPLDVTLRFERAAAGRSLPLLRFSARRLGMAATWFRGDFARVLAEKSPDVSFGALQALAFSERAAFVATGRCSGARWGRLVGRAREQRALISASEHENAIYLYQSEGPSGRALPPQSFVLTRDGAER